MTYSPIQQNILKEEGRAHLEGRKHFHEGWPKTMEWTALGEGK